jgi:glycosyltransferase involved in cell wall biosynthesis
MFQSNTTRDKNNNIIHKRENDYYKTNEELLNEYQKAKIYFDNCLSGKIIDKNRTIIKSENPNISVVIPVYNSQNIIKPVIRSIQNQNFTNLEIVLVNDFSTDDSKIIIEQLQREDPRIRLLNNKKNMGTLYSRSVGTLAVKGSYIFPLDNDDLFYDETIFDIVYRLAVNGSFDIVEFKAVEHTNYIIDTSKKMKDSEYSNHKNNLVLYQPELGRFPRIRNNKYGVYDCFLWAKCIKSDIYKKTLNKLGEKSYSLRIIWGEDLVTSFALFRTASSFKFIGKYGIFRYKNKKTASNNTPYKLYALSIVLYMDVVYDFTSNSIEDKKYAVDVAIGYFRNIRMIRELNDPQRKYLNTILAKYLKSKFINEVDKNRIRNIFSKYNKLGIVVN